MGLCQSRSISKSGVQILVRTGWQKGKGTDSNVFIVLYDKTGRKTGTVKLSNRFEDNFESGQTDSFKIDTRAEDGKPLLDVAEIEIWKDDAGFSEDWFCDVIILLDTTSGHSIPFPMQRWIRSNVKYRVPAYDTSLPQDDPYKEQRHNELEYKRSIYKYKAVDKGLPGLIEKNPKEEAFTLDYYVELLAGQIIMGRFKSIFTGLSIPSKWKTPEDFRKAFDNNRFELPESADWWDDDEWFAAMRINGPNPCVIRLCTEIPKDFAIKEDEIRPHLENQDLEAVLAEKKLFILDNRVLDGIQGNNNMTVVSPMGLFYLNSQGKLMPVAIQLYAKPAPDNPVFYPSDNKNLWTFVKMWFNMADAHLHQGVYHLGFTHLAMESTCIAFHRCLAPNHPVFRLLGPHYYHLFAINQAGLSGLVTDGAELDRISNIGGRGSLEGIRRLWSEWRFDVEGDFIQSLKSRGVLDESVLPVYPYRDDGMLSYDVIKTYVTEVLNIYYGENHSKIEHDHELRNWGKMMAAPVEEYGAGIKGIPKNGEFTSLEDIITTCTNIMFICTVQHAAINFAIYFSCAFAPNMPTMLSGVPPKTKDPVEMADMMKRFPPKSTILSAMQLMKTLGQRASKPLGDWDILYQYDRRAIEAEQRFKGELLRISEIIKQRNKERSKYNQYDYLDPEFIPNSISI